MASLAIIIIFIIIIIIILFLLDLDVVHTQINGFSMDENSHLASYPNDACMQKEGQKVSRFGQCQVEDKSKAPRSYGCLVKLFNRIST
jgi:hypothetical protein